MRVAALTFVLFRTPHFKPLPLQQGEKRAETRGFYRTLIHKVTCDALRQRRRVEFEFHSTNFLAALAMKPTPARRIANIIEPVPGHFSISSRFVE